MPIRITGLNSGLDTESLVSALVSAYRTKTEKYTKAQTKLSWKQTAWSSLNTKINSFYKSLDALRFTSGYNTKKVNVSDTTKVSVTANNNAVNGTQMLEVNEVAKAGYLTGAKLGNNVTGSTKLSDVDGFNVTDEATISVTANGRTTNLSINGDMTMNDLAKSLSEAGVKASFDSTNHRFFISAKDSGKDNDFSLTAGDADGLTALKALGLNASSSAADKANYEKYAAYMFDAAGNSYYQMDSDGNFVRDSDGKLKINSLFDPAVSGSTAFVYDESKTKDMITDIRKNLSDYSKENVTKANDISYANAYKNVEDTKSKFTNANEWDLFQKLVKRTDAENVYVMEDGTAYKVKDDGSGNYTATLADGDGTDAPINLTKKGDKYELADGTVLTNGAVRLAELEVTAGFATKNVGDDGGTNYSVDYQLVNKFTKDLSTKNTYESDPANAATKTIIQNAYDGIGPATIESLTSGWQADIDRNKTYLEEHQLLANDTESPEMLAKKVTAAKEMLEDPDKYASKGAVKVDGTDARITLNGAEYTSADNNFEINGLSISALAKTNGEISLTTENDVSGMYDKIKNFLTSYNTLINEMTSLYNAPSSKGYEPLTDEEREAMSDTEIEKWETKIKDSLLRRDNTLGSIMSLMTNAMAKSYKVDGKNLSLASFGIATLGIFDSAENQQNAYHIYGDEDDASTASKDDKLMAALRNNPDQVINFMTQLTNGLYNAIDKKMGSTTMSSKYVVYNDKEMAREYSDYTDTISKWEEKLTAQEDYYYKKFSAMETALAKLQAQQSQLSGLLGM